MRDDPRQRPRQWPQRAGDERPAAAQEQVGQPPHQQRGTDPQQGRIVELRYFAGLTIEETADALEISPATVKRDWVVAKAFLKREMLRR